MALSNGDGENILHTNAPDFPKLTAGTLRENVGEVPTFEFTILPDHPRYNHLRDRISDIVLTNTETQENEFEGYMLESPEYMTAAGKLYKKALCEGYMGYLNDSIQMYHHYEEYTPAEFLKALLENHNAQTEEHKHIYLGMVNISGDTNSKTTNYGSTLAEIKENLIDRIGGEIRVRRGDDGRLLLDYLDAVTVDSTSDTVIELGNNLKSLTIESDTTNVVTRLIPLGAQLNEISPNEKNQGTAERLTIEDAVIDGKRYGKVYIDDEAAIEKYGIIVGTAEFDDITVPENLYARGKTHLSENNRVKKHYSASVLDLSGKGSIRAGNSYHFRNRLMNLDEPLRLLGRTVDILKPWTPTVEIGDKTTKISGVTAQNRKMIDYEIPKQISQTVQATRDIASILITAATTGYVVIRPNEILIMDTDDVETATSVWRFNQGGLGYSHSNVPGEAYNGPFNLAMTMNGQIVADFIAAGTMYADRIRGGTLKLGGSDGMDGVMQVYDSSGTEIVRFDKNGAYIFGTVYTKNADGYWLEMKDGNLTGGKDGSTYSTINATAQVTDTDSGITYNGLSIASDAVYFDCTLFAINGGIGTSGDLDLTQGISVETQTIENVAVLNPDGQTHSYYNLTFVSAVYANNTAIRFRNGIMCTGI